MRAVAACAGPVLLRHDLNVVAELLILQGWARLPICGSDEKNAPQLSQGRLMLSHGPDQ